jgi:hypothetical protein
VATLYDTLGSTPASSQEELQQAYRRAARRLHPDVNPGAETEEAMRALNDAWAVLGDPDRRRRYDAQIGLGTTQAAPRWEPTRWETTVDDIEGGERRRSRLFRPSVIAIAILGVIFVVTAYAAPSHTDRRPATRTPSATQTTPPTPASASEGLGSNSTGLVGKCILKLLGYDAVAVCNQRGAQLVVAEVAATADCPAGTTVYQLEGRSQLVCLSPSGS